MLPFCLLLVSLLAAQSQAKVFFKPEEAESLFEEFIDNFNKYYSNEEEKTFRFNVFKENLKKINDRNARSSLAEYGINHFTDLTVDEFVRKYTGLRLPSQGAGPVCKESNPLDVTGHAPESLDWRKEGKVTAIKNQGQCGSCWAFGTTGTLEGAYAIKHNTLVSLSEQQLLDCDKKNSGCCGGFMDKAMMWLMKNGGSMREVDYPYKSQEGKCAHDESKVAVNVTGCTQYIDKTEDELKQILANVGPLAIAVVGNTFNCYTNGIHECDTSGDEINHAVLLVGYGEENGTPYWIVKNSWGTGWGEEGYIRLPMYKNACRLRENVFSGIVE
ncbi:hypothetical protein evm_006097 [Chilo suppressalis]|nr:hypothetical protein evm_006097 [Chilo suppressalis]